VQVDLCHLIGEAVIIRFFHGTRYFLGDRGHVPPVPVAARSKAWVCGACLLSLWVRIPPEAWTFVCCECCQVEVFATSWSLVRKSRTDSGASFYVI
jgi:hypothetical protein